jgi:hypothetical protein
MTTSCHKVKPRQETYLRPLMLDSLVEIPVEISDRVKLVLGLFAAARHISLCLALKCVSLTPSPVWQAQDSSHHKCLRRATWCAGGAGCTWHAWGGIYSPLALPAGRSPARYCQPRIPHISRPWRQSQADYQLGIASWSSVFPADNSYTFLDTHPSCWGGEN